MNRSMGTRAAAALSLALAFAFSAGEAAAQQGKLPFELFSAAEAQKEQKAAADHVEPPRMRSSAPPRPGPAIKVLAPSITSAVAAPLRIELVFEPLPGSRIVPGSFRVLYGVLKIDLTERLRRHATVTESGVVVEQAMVPDGVHRLFIQVADDKGNQAEHELRVRVGATS
jgi:hypothetical protein